MAETSTTSGTEDPTKPHYHSQALTRGLTTIRAVATSDSPATLNDIHESTGLPKSTLVRLLSVLEENDYLLRVDERPAYRLGHALLPIAAGYFNAVTVKELVQPHLAALATATGWTANFGVLEGTGVLHLCVEFPERPLYYATSEGSLDAAYRTGLGKAILAELDDEAVLKALPAEPFERLTPHTITTVAEMRAELAAIRERGYAIDAQEADLGLRCFAVAIPGSHGPLGALSVSGPAGESTQARETVIAQALHTARAALMAIPELESTLGKSLASPAP